jgi:hypothetical protein
MANEPKIYCGTGKIKDWDKGPPSIDFAFSEKDIETLREHLDNGWVRIRISQRKSPSDKGQTHYATVNTWKPERREDDPPPPSKERKAEPTDDSQDGSLPF